MGRKSSGLVKRRAVTVRGIVQGVGFRPFVWRFATDLHLSGWVCNTEEGVSIEVQGPEAVLDRFVAELPRKAPGLARIESITTAEIPPRLEDRTFVIRNSQGTGAAEALIPPDLALCPDCRREILDVGDRHYRYPFTNCTACGPRFTVVTGLPYDRSRTTLASFPMCSECRAEYEDPGDRRFHAQPTACPRCGPRAWVTDGEGRELPGPWAETARRLIAQGKIVAVKGLGGYHLACDATSEAAVARLRQRKHRPAKPLAVMYPAVDRIRIDCHLSPAEQALLESPEAPIVVLRKREGGGLAAAVAPGLDTVGVMLPYTPLHVLLLEGSPPLVMTSGNRGGLPIVRDNEQALAELGGIADYFLMHNRPIAHRCDDSVVKMVGESTQLIRRSRGYVPRPLPLVLPPGIPAGACPGRTRASGAAPVAVVALGAQQKNAVCLTRGDQAFLSQHLGEMDCEEGIDYLREALEGLATLLGVEPEVVALDLHPQFSLTGLASSLPQQQVKVQHHHAHLASVLVDRQEAGPVVGVVADGVGYGEDGQVWGLEFLVGNLEGFRRVGQLAYVPLPGGEGAIRRPARMAVSYLYYALGEEGRRAGRYLPLDDREMEVTWQLCRRPGLLTSSAGRLFDAVSALLGICCLNTYEGQAAVELEEEAWRAAGVLEADVEEGWPWVVERRDGRWLLDPRPVVGVLAEELMGRPESGWEPGYRAELAARFHLGLADAISRVAKAVADEAGLRKVVLSGGTFQNGLLTTLVRRELLAAGLECLLPERVPVNDGGLALGQAAVAIWRWAAGR